ncbi:hypothetical protein Ctha_0498 [Chloroherpeton thalassium ATCC 35110]|uniref:Secretion system C-terminal sorting domain-containing protein n=1 Tax=Chloroherpeton thalassium (strain ATCC 35110 / GB-78) TaxID=517418 RepID=B3QUR3_CHLT3|nr:T9SS type A sorting domain-containing protein [Chloroherpeton thalassium]ACF12969.1 hypothetical protein Ctha_0498 [Chloroherpeton thalassium ATCC 35110]
MSATVEKNFSGVVSGVATTQYHCNITAKAASFSDLDNKAGVSESAADGFDAASDIPEPPHAPTGYVSLYFPHPEWNHAEYEDFMHDIRANGDLSAEAEQWPFEVATDQTGTDVSLAFSLHDIPSGVGVTCLDKDSGTLINLRDTTEYAYAAQSLRKFVLSIGDSTKPEIALTAPNGGETFFHGDAVNIAWQAADASGLLGYRLYATPLSSGEKTLIAEMSGSQRTYEWTVPEDITGAVRLSISATDSLFNESEVALATDIRISSSEHVFLPGWTLMSVPFLPANASADSVLGQFVPQYYYLYNYQPNSGFAVSDTVEFTKGYWLTSPDTVRVAITGEVQDTASLTLQAEWNIAGNALYEFVPKSALKVEKEGQTKSFDDAVKAGWLSPACYGFSTDASSYVEADTLEPWAGYWIAAIDSNLTLIFDGDELGGTETKAMATKSFATSSDATDWSVQLAVKSGTEADLISVCGTDANATDEFDASFDLPEPPLPPKKNGVSLYFSHENWPEVLGDKYNADIRAPLADKESKSWEFEVENANAVMLSWNAPSISGLSLRLEDLSNGQVINMLTENEYGYTGSDAEPVRKFKLTATRDVSAVEETEAATPYEYVLAQNYPNPFNPSTTIRFSLKQAGMATFKVFDMLGREILSEQIAGKAGWNTYTFKANALSSGIYFYRLQAGAFSETKKMMLLR